MKLLRNDEENKSLLESISKSESYLKARYQKHCTDDDSCISHCINHALSHPKDKELMSSCSKVHDRYCVECQNLNNCVEQLKTKINHLPPSHQKEVAEWEVSNASFKIMAWQKHILRGVQQSKARSHALNELGPATALWLRDYSQKFNPSKVKTVLHCPNYLFENKFRLQTLEGMSEYFGKRGMSVSVEVFITKSLTDYQKQVYLVSLDRCDQGCIETLCIADKVLEKFRTDNPFVNKIFLKTDNAGIMTLQRVSPIY